MREAFSYGVGIDDPARWTGYAAWRQLRRHGGGRLELDLDAQTLTFVEP
jgi:hypothetical protein